MPAMSESEYYGRQIVLCEIGLAGQEKLKAKKVLIVGAGGLGHPAAIYLAAAGIGEIGIVDFDRVALSNLNRQIGFAINDIGKNKAHILAEKIKMQNPYIKVTPIEKKLLAENVVQTLSPFDLILDCSDNLPTKFLLHDFCWHLGKDLIQASIYKYEGQLQCFNYANKKDEGCWRCLWRDGSPNPGVQNCEDAGIIGAIAGIVGTHQAFAAIKMILQLGELPTNKTVIIDPFNIETQKISWSKNAQCSLCSANITQRELCERHRLQRATYEKEGLDHPDFILVDIREENETEWDDALQGHNAIARPLSDYLNWREQVRADVNYLFVCQQGIRSKSLVQKLRKENMNNCYSLFRGLSAQH